MVTDKLDLASATQSQVCLGVKSLLVTRANNTMVWTGALIKHSLVGCNGRLAHFVGFVIYVQLLHDSVSQQTK